MALLIGFPSNQWEATREERDDLIYLMRKRHPDQSEAQCYDALCAMTCTDRWRLLHGRYDDVGDAGADYDGYGGYDSPQSDSDCWGPVSPPPAAAPTVRPRGPRRWYDGK
jgi:hypothetical protein